MNTYPTIKTRYGIQTRFSNERLDKHKSLYLIHASQLLIFRDAIEVAKQVLSQEQIWPDQCDYIIFKVKPLQKAAKSILQHSTVIERQSNKQSSYNHYSTLVSASYFSEQIDKFIAFIQEYKEITDRTSAKRSTRKLILGSLHHVDLSLQDLIKELDSAFENS